MSATRRCSWMAASRSTPPGPCRRLPYSMLKRLLSTLLLLSLCTGLRAADTTSFRAMLDRYYEDYLALYPIEAAINGDNDPRYEAIWPNDISAEHHARVVAMCD